MTTVSIDFWFTMGSTYTGLTASRYQSLADSMGVAVRLRIFRGVGALTGSTTLPFVEGTAKSRYMWRDIERRASAVGTPLRMPVPYPAPHPVRANRVALVGLREGWGVDYVREAYRLWFTEGIANGGDENLRAALTSTGNGSAIDRILAEADSQPITDELTANTEKAKALGIFGAPTFAVGEELFWGDDHMEEAMAWALRR